MNSLITFLKTNYLTLLLIVATLVYWSASSLMNPFAMALLALLVVDLVWRSKTYSQLLSGFFLLLAAYMCLALFSELDEFAAFDKDAILLLVFGTTYLGSVIGVSSFRLYKFSQNS